jgi:predicted NBD/HSP70 family sugar kinase
VDLDGMVVRAPNLEWTKVPLQAALSDRFGVPVVVANDANTSVLAEHSFGHGTGDLMLVRIGPGVGAGLLLGGSALHGSRFAAGEIGHVVVGTDGGDLCSCGSRRSWRTPPSVPHAMTSFARPTLDSASPSLRSLVRSTSATWC